VPTLSLAQNTLLTRTGAVGAGGWIRVGDVAALAESLIRRFNVKAGGPGVGGEEPVGGNLQKFIVGREIDAKPKLLVVSQPTWGVDVGAAAQIRAELLALRDAGCAVLVVSEELDELFEICDRLVVIAQGRVSPSIATAEATVERHRRVDERPVGSAGRRQAMLKLEARPEPSRAMSIASPLIALAITVVIGTCLFLILGKDPLRGLAVFFVEPVKSVYALTELAGEGDAAAADRARPGGVLSLQRLEHRRRRPVHRRRALRRAAWRCRRRPTTGGWFFVAVIAAGVVGGMCWAASSRSCAIASTPTRSWSA
jgi:hypothetical protein